MAAGEDTLDNKKMYELMQEHLSTQKSLWQFKKVSAAFFCIIIILALSNLGTSFAAAYLSKDTTASGGEIKDKEGSTLGVQTSANTYPISPVAGGRYGAGCSFEGGTCATTQPKKCCPGYVCNSGTEQCEVDDNVSSFLELDMQQGKKMVMDCKEDRTVHVSRKFESGLVMEYALCPLEPGNHALYDLRDANLPSVKMNSPNGQVIIAPNEEGTFYTITGAGITSDAGFPCDDGGDCDAGLVCTTKNLTSLCEAAVA